MIAKETIFVGGLNQSIVHPREVFQATPSKCRRIKSFSFTIIRRAMPALGSRHRDDAGVRR
ncbi:MAG: hypothetical protein MZU97_25120 [Bacillus subtilis]|nr:hypothetical protein [Bacillus subtilis]